MAPSPAAGKATDTQRTPPKLGKTEDAKEQAGKVGSEASDSVEENTGKVSQPGDTKGELGEVEPAPIDEPGDAVAGAQETAKGATEEAEDTADDATEKAGETADDVEEGDDTQDDAKKGDSGLLGGAKGLAGEATSLAGKGTENLKDKAGGLTGQQLPETSGLEILKGLSPDEKGIIHDADGNAVGKLVEGDAEDLVGYEIGDDGEILDDDGDLVGRCEVLPETERKLKDNLPLDAKLPDISILKGLTVDATGQILNDDGDTVGQLIEGNPADLAGREINEKGEILDDDGNVIGRARVHPDAAGLVGKAEEAGQDVGDTVQEGAEGVKDGVPEEIEAELPGVDALEGKEINSQGEILGEDGEVIGKLAEGKIEDVKGLTVNEKGEVVDADGNVLGRVELAEGAAEKLKDISSLLDIRILEGLKVNKKGKVLDEEGEEIGQLVEGDPKMVAGKTVNDKGEVVDKQGNVIGKVEIVPGDAAAEAMKALKERLAEAGEPVPGTKEIFPDLQILDGLKVNKKGQILNEDGEPIGELVEGKLSDCAGQKVNDKGEVLDKDGKVIGKVRTLPQQVEGAAEEAGENVEDVAEDAGADLPPLSILEGLTVNKYGKIIDNNGNIVGELVEGDPKKLSKSGAACDAEGQFWDNKGHIIGRAKTVPAEDKEEDAPFAGLEGLIVVKGGYVEDENGNRVGVITEGDPKKLVGRSVDEDGDIIDKKGTVVGHAERYDEPEEPEEEPVDNSILANKVLNKQGYVVGEDGVPIGRLVEGNAKDLAGRKCDDQGLIYNDTGKVVGRCEVIPESERTAKAEGPFAGYEGLKVNQDGKVEDIDGNVVGILVDGNPKKLVGHAVDEDGDIIDKYGNVKGHAEPWEPEEEPEADLSALAGGTVNKAGNVISPSGQVVGRVVEGDLKNMVGKKVDGKGQIWDNAGNIVGRAELVQGVDDTPEGPFAGFEDLEIKKDGTVQTPSGDIVGRIIEGDVKKLMGHHVDDDGDITDKNGNVIGKAERWEPEEKERKVNPMAGRRVNKQGEVRDENGDVMGRLTAGDLGHCVGLEIDDNGYVVDNDGNKVGEVTLLENIVDEEESEEEKKKREDAELADKMANICQQTLERVQPVMKQITEHIEKADRTPRDELDEEELVNNVKPLIEEGARILQECNGSLRGLDPDGRIAAQAKGRAGTREATPEEYRLADLLKELTSTVVTTIDNAKKRISDMPHAKKKLNPLWALLTEPLFQIIAAVGLLLSGVLGLVGRLLNALGLGGLVNGLLGGLGIDKLLGGLGLGSLSESLGLSGKKKEKKGAGSLPVVGGLLGGGK